MANIYVQYSVIVYQQTLNLLTLIHTNLTAWQSGLYIKWRQITWHGVYYTMTRNAKIFIQLSIDTIMTECPAIIIS